MYYFTVWTLYLLHSPNSTFNINSMNWSPHQNPVQLNQTISGPKVNQTYSGEEHSEKKFKKVHTCFPTVWEKWLQKTELQIQASNKANAHTEHLSLLSNTNEIWKAFLVYHCKRHILTLQYLAFYQGRYRRNVTELLWPAHYLIVYSCTKSHDEDVTWPGSTALKCVWVLWLLAETPTLSKLTKTHIHS